MLKSVTPPIKQITDQSTITKLMKTMQEVDKDIQQQLEQLTECEDYIEEPTDDEWTALKRCTEKTGIVFESIKK